MHGLGCPPAQMSVRGLQVPCGANWPGHARQPSARSNRTGAAMLSMAFVEQAADSDGFLGCSKQVQWPIIGESTNIPGWRGSPEALQPDSSRL